MATMAHGNTNTIKRICTTMIAINEKTKEEVTGLLNKLMEGKITNQQFEELTGLEPSEGNPSRAAWIKRNNE